MPKLSDLKNDLRQAADSKQAVIMQGYHKTGKGEYAEGDVFLGIKVPVLRGFAKKYFDLSLTDLSQLLKNKIHDYRFVALVILVGQFEKADSIERKKIFDFYLKNIKYINNWDLVDTSAPQIVGGYLLDKSRATLYKLARSKNLWAKRVAVLGTLAFIREKQFTDTFRISEILIDDDHDLIHKAVGWMLREVGNRDQAAEEKFLKKYYKIMPRTMLRYAIEKFNKNKRMFYLKKI